jgi:hypothetical protein
MERDNKDMTAQDLVSALTGLDDRPWSEWRRGHSITKTGIARMLKPFKIRPKKVRTGTNTKKVYLRTSLVEAKARYVDEATEVEEEPM